MQSAAEITKLSVEGYFIFEEANEVRHEFYNGKLYEMSGASPIHHRLCKRLLYFFEAMLLLKNFEVFMENMKVKIPNENIFLYPDIIVTSEPQNDDNLYAQHAPELLAEVVSESSRTKDMVDKLLQYQKFPSLKYYLILEQDKPEITIISRDAKGNWQSETIIGIDSTIHLPLMNIQLALKEIYNS